ncbi:MAG: amidohydrolase [Bacteroidetes bacterium]|nr:amidohydrolase [Bacteroidota bacterium]MBS1756022.1 amidohydrolase [Bacteroidota bacterium]
MSTLTITSIQTNLFWENKQANLRMLQEKINSIPDHAEIVVLPEMFSTGFSMNAATLAETMDGNTINWMKEISAKQGIILTGSIIIKEEEKYFNRLIWMLPNGNYGYYDKRHLFAFAGENQNYSSGNKRLIASVKGWKINVQICYDLRFPVWARQNIISQQEGQEYDVLLYVANWPGRRSHAWKTLLCARAIENQAYVVGVNRVGNDGNNIYHSGNSMMIDPLGEVLYHMEDDEDIFTITLQKEHVNQVREKYPFWKDADNFKINL